MIKIGIIGTGYFGAVHAEAIGLVPDARVSAVCGGQIASAAAFAEKFGGKPFAGWQQLLADSEVDAVVIATPHHVHAEIATVAIAAGKHVLLEKPMAPSVAACLLIEQAVARSEAKFMVGHLIHFFRPLMAAHEIIASGQLGVPLTGASTLAKFWMAPNRRPWHLDKATGGGMLLTAGIHAIDQLVWLMGGRVAGVSALAGTYFHDQSADDTALLCLRFEDGRIGQVASLGYRNGATTSIVQIVCEDGIIDIDLNKGVRIGQDEVWREVPDSWESQDMAAAVGREWAAFLGSIRNGTAPAIDAAYGRQIVAITEAAFVATETRREAALSQWPAAAS